MNIKATAVQTHEYKSKRQWLSGYHEGYEAKRVWKVQIQIGPTNYFTSNKSYKDHESARRAAIRMEEKFSAA